MQYSQRIHNELKAVGFNMAGMTDGLPLGDWFPYDPVVMALFDVHIPDDTVYIATDLTVSAAALQTTLGDDTGKWAAYLKVQTDLIRVFRTIEYSGPGGIDEQYHQLFSDGTAITDIQTTLVAVKATVKAKYPWPGSYR